MTGEELPDLATPVPGPRSRELARRLARVESRNVTRIDRDGPIFWAEGTGALIVDVDGNRFIDLTAGFGVCATGHANPVVAEAVARQARTLPHAMGDVHPGTGKVELLERLARITPGDLGVSVLSANGSDAVESALKTALLATGRPGVIAFRGAYHGLGYGALAVTGIPRFRDPFAAQLAAGVRFVDFPAASPDDPNGESGASRERLQAAVGAVRTELDAADRSDYPVGAVIIEPIQGRGGIRVPVPGFLSELRRVCSDRAVTLIFDEVYTGLGRTGRWFACEHEQVVPDVLVVGKALAGGLPLSAAVGTPSIMAAWPESGGEALHTSTFLGNPVTCAAALAQLEEIEAGGLVGRAAELGAALRTRLDRWVAEREWAGSARGRGLMQALVLAGEGRPERAEAVVLACLRRGVLVLPEGDAIAFTPPLTIREPQLEHALDVLEDVLAEAWG